MKEEEKFVASSEWNYCDKSDPDSLISFKIHNKAKDEVRRYNKLSNKFSNIQRKVKKQLSK